MLNENIEPLRVLTLEEYACKLILKYPLLYVNHLSVSQVADQVTALLFNVIGNGIHDVNDLKLEISAPLFDTIDKDRANKYMAEPLFQGYTSFCEDLSELMGRPVPDIASKKCTCFEHEKANHPDVVFWKLIEKQKNEEAPRVKRFLFPNFDKQYSLIWSPGVKDFLPQEWKLAVLSYYRSSLEFFKSEEPLYYDLAFPSADSDSDKKRVADLELKISKMTADQIYAEMGPSYTGDARAYLNSAWEKEKNRTIAFIQETLDYLQS